MTAATFSLSAFGDEIAPDLETQLQLLRDLRIPGLELRSVWGKNVLQLDMDEAARVRSQCATQGITVSCIGSPIGKSPILDPIEREVTSLEQIFRVAEQVGTRWVRVFSFYPPDRRTNAGYDDYLEEASNRLGRLAGMARREGIVLLLENEKEIVGDTPQRCHDILRAVNSPSLRFLWDPANFVQVGVERPAEASWSLLAPYLAYVHIKDALLHDGSICAAGEGNGQIPELLIALRNAGYQGMLALEPHLAFAGPQGGFSGAESVAYAAKKLRDVMAAVGCDEQPGLPSNGGT